MHLPATQTPLAIPDTLKPVLDRLRGVRRSGRGWEALCPAHDDHEPSLSVAEGKDGRVLLNCHAGCPAEAVVAALGMQWGDLFADAGRREREGGAHIPPETAATLQQPQLQGLTLAQYADAKRLPLEFLQGLGLGDVSSCGRPAVRVPYRDQAGVEIATRFRVALTGAERFYWKRRTRPCPYGLWRLGEARRNGDVVLVEGESDTQTLWVHKVPALGLPGAASWQESWADFLTEIPLIYVVIEPDQGGQAVEKWLASSSIRDRTRLVRLGTAKDVSALYLSDPKQFLARWKAALEAAIPWAQVSRRETWRRCSALAREPRILDRFAEALQRRGVVGELRAGKLLYLVVTSRILSRPVSAVPKGSSAVGKNFVAGHILEFFPPRAYYVLTAMSERALAYSSEPLAHRVLVLYEAVGLGEFAFYLVRSLLSEGRVCYETVERTNEGLRPRRIEREGPTGLLMTTTAVRLHPENETRYFSIPITDTPEQTRSILERQGQDAERGDDGTAVEDLTPWRAFQEWLDGGERRVKIPFASRLARLIPPVAVRLRRDFRAILQLIKAHTLLHQVTRPRAPDGAVIATLEDYAAVRELIADLVAEEVEFAVSPTIRETVEAVRALHEEGADGVTVTALGDRLTLDKSVASRRVQAAITKGYLGNLEHRKGRPARLVLGEAPLPAEMEILPRPDDPRLGECCTVAVESEGIDTPPSSRGPDPLEEVAL